MVLAALRLGNRGTSLLEVAVVVSILGISTSVAVSRLNAGTRHIDSAHQELVANLRLCRAQAVAGGFHCEVAVTSSTSYRVAPSSSRSVSFCLRHRVPSSSTRADRW
jgi:Tfp pilus assembly protein FimT